MARQTVFDIKIGGKKRRMNFGMVCWEYFCEKMNVTPTDILPTFQGVASFRAMRTLVFSAIAADDYLKGEPTSVTEREVAGWLNDEPEKIGEVFTLAVRLLMPEADPAKDGVPVKVEPSAAGAKKKGSPSRRSKK